MCKSLETGIWSENIRNRMRPVLSIPNVSDVRLLKEISLAVQSEKRRKEKFNTKRQLRVSIIEPGEKEEEEDDESEAVKEIQRLKKEICSLKYGAQKEQEQKDIEILKMITELKGEISELKTRNKSNTNRSYGCNNCKKDGTAHLCNHCFRCGSTDHKIKDCPKTAQNSSNWNRPLMGDDQ